MFRVKHELPNLTRLSVEEKDALILAQFEQIDQSTVIVQTFIARVRELQGRLRKDSHNSSKPPTSDGLAKKPKSLRRSSGRKPGGQAGHPGSTLKRVANPDVTVQHPLPEHSELCGADLGAQAAAVTEDRRQSFRFAHQPLTKTQLSALRRQYEAILTEGERVNPRCARTHQSRGRVKQSTAVNLLLRLRCYADAVLRFVADLRVPFDNHQAERDSRMPKLKQKASGCFRTVTGAESFCTSRSYVATLRKQGRDGFQALILVFQGHPPDPLPSGQAE